jgi:hypothetical protein
MSKTLLLAATLSLAWVVSAHAEKPKKWLIEPPAEYDHPYKGELLLWPVKSQADVRAFCPESKFAAGFALACARVRTGRCTVAIAPDDELRKFGFTHEIVWRHEIAHCNGWPGDHPNVRYWQLGPEPVAKAEKPCGLAIQKPCEPEPENPLAKWDWGKILADGTPLPKADPRKAAVSNTGLGRLLFGRW